ncbi:hypothetical protein TSUD_168820 [Trifolium subterraneum]|nr:hypothetical protein TSUD_168820 [Trifolium subterraneum]
MTIGNLAPKTERKKSSRKSKNKAVVSENAPLLPKCQADESDSGFDDFNGASFSGAVFNLATTIIGAGIMALPATLKQLGLIPGLAAILIMAFLTEKSIELLIRFTRAGKSVSYAGLMGDSFGKYGKALAQICVIVNNIGVLIVYMIIIVHSIDNELEDNSQMQGVVRTALGLCSSVYLMISFFGFLLFGEGTLDDVLANFDADLGIPFGSLLNDAVRISYAAHLMLVFPVVFFPLRLNIDGLLFPKSRPLVLDNFRFASMTVALIGVIFLGANFIPSIWDAFQFTGATAAVCIGFIFPAAITLKDRYNIATKSDKILCVVLIILAVFSNIVAIYSDAYALIKQNKTKRE